MKLPLLFGLFLFSLDQSLKTFFFIPTNAYVANDAWLTILMAPFFLSFIVFVYFQRKRFLKLRYGHVAVGLVCGGALSNIVDVLARGGVIDYVSLFDLVHFNLADVGVLLGLLYMSWAYLRLPSKL